MTWHISDPTECCVLFPVCYSVFYKQSHTLVFQNKANVRPKTAKMLTKPCSGALQWVRCVGWEKQVIKSILITSRQSRESHFFPPERNSLVILCKVGNDHGLHTLNTQKLEFDLKILFNSLRPYNSDKLTLQFRHVDQWNSSHEAERTHLLKRFLTPGKGSKHEGGAFVSLWAPKVLKLRLGFH